MNTNVLGLHKVKFVYVSMVCLIFLLGILPIAAQNDDLSLSQSAEYDIGLNCPVASTLDPTGRAIWILMNNCFQSRYQIHVYDLVDGTRFDVDDYAAELENITGTNIYIDSFSTPMGFTPAGDLSIYYSDYGSDIPEISRLIIPLASGGEVITETSDDYNAFLAEYSDYPEYSVYSPDHTQVVASGTSSFHVLDVEAETEIVEISLEGGFDTALASFSQDGQHLHVVRSNNPDDMDDLSSTLFIYNLPDGTLLQEYPVPSPIIWVSPDERYAAVTLFSNHVGDQNEVMVVNLETGATSEVSNLNEEPARVLTCLNDGRDMSDVDFMTSGQFSYPTMHWLADNSGFVLALSYGGEGAGGGSPCLFNYSRLRSYIIEGAD